MKGTGTGEVVGLVHGYGLSGSGSNLWTRSVVRALCREGYHVHLVCQESRPEALDFVGEARTWDAAARPTTLFRRDVPGPGRCTVHRPDLEVLPTYVRPRTPSDYVVSILDLDTPRIEGYLRRNEAVLERVAREAGIRAFHVNHVLLLAEALRRLRARTGVGYAVMPHGSAIEYVARKSREMRDLAHRALEEADRVLLLNQDIRRRLDEVFPGLSDLEKRSRVVRAGVDTDHFRIVPRQEREQAWSRVTRALQGAERGRSQQDTRRFLERVENVQDLDSFRVALEEGVVPGRGRPDRDVERRLGQVAWGRDPVILYIGRLVGGKGVPSVVMALPDILDVHLHARLVLIGDGPLREMLEALVHALATGCVRLARDILAWGDQLDPEGAEPFLPSRLFLERLERKDELGEWLGRARQLEPDRVLFTGFLEHDALRHLVPLADVGVFPSVVDEASPLVVAEAAACGCFPMGTWRSGMKETLMAIGGRLPHDLRPLMAVGPEPERVVDDITRNVDQLLARREDGAPTGPQLRAVAVETFDWRQIAAALVDALREVRGVQDASGPAERYSSRTRGGEGTSGRISMR